MNFLGFDHKTPKSLGFGQGILENEPKSLGLGLKTNLIPQNFRLRRKPKNIDFSVLNLRIATHPPTPPGVVIFTKS